MSIKQKLKGFFKVNRKSEASEAAVELLRMWILPFSREFKRMSVDDVIGAFFGLDHRNFVYAKALRGFNLPGKYYVAGRRPVYGLGPRRIISGQCLLLALDRDTNTARVEAVIDGQTHNFLLEKFELETIKDWLRVIE